MHIVSTRERLDRKRGGFYAKYTLPIDGLALRHIREYLSKILLRSENDILFAVFLSDFRCLPEIILLVRIS